MCDLTFLIYKRNDIRKVEKYRFVFCLIVMKDFPNLIGFETDIIGLTDQLSTYNVK